MATPEAIHCIGCAKDISKSSRDQESLCQIPLATQLQDSKLCLMDFLDTGDQKGAEKIIANSLSIPLWKDGKNIPPSKERHYNFQLQAFQLSYSS